MGEDSTTRRSELVTLARQYALPLDRARRLYLDESSFAIGSKKNAEFEIKSRISQHFAVPFRAVVFCGSAHLGFSPHKDTEFTPGVSDLDVAIVSMEAFQRAWMTLNEATKALNDLSGFVFHKNPEATIENIRTMMIKRGLLHLSSMPTCKTFDSDRAFLDQLSKGHRRLFATIGVTSYMNEYAFCWKQTSAIQHLLG